MKTLSLFAALLLPMLSFANEVPKVFSPTAEACNNIHLYIFDMRSIDGKFIAGDLLPMNQLTVSYDCCKLASNIREKGIVNLSADGRNYTKFVASQALCLEGESLSSIIAPSKDFAGCVLNTCKAAE